jgi:hypothetical protein
VLATDRGDIAGSPRRLWAIFDAPRRPAGTRWLVTFPTPSTAHLADVTRHGCGVTGLDADDCWRLVRDAVFAELPVPPVRDAVFDIDVSTLDADWVLPQIGNPAALGVWFPAWNARPLA